MIRDYIKKSLPWSLAQYIYRHLTKKGKMYPKILVMVFFLTGLGLATPIRAENADQVRQLLETGACRRCALEGANLRDADLRLADLRDTDLKDADLRGADLREADLRRADLTDANLKGADLRGTYLRLTNLTDANLKRANLCGVIMPDGEISEQGCE